MNIDPEGHFFWFFLIGLIIGAILGGAIIGGIIGGAIGWTIGVATVGLPSLGSGGLAFAGGGSIAIATIAEVAVAIATIGIVFARIGKSGGYKIDHHYPNDHDPLHVHISGDDILGGTTKVDINGVPLPGQSPLT